RRTLLTTVSAAGLYACTTTVQAPFCHVCGAFFGRAGPFSLRAADFLDVQALFLDVQALFPSVRTFFLRVRRIYGACWCFFSACGRYFRRVCTRSARLPVRQLNLRGLAGDRDGGSEGLRRVGQPLEDVA